MLRMVDPIDEEQQRQEEHEEHEERESAYELLQRGHELLKGRHYAQAATVLERADREEPGKASILEALGRAYYNSGQHERSRATFEALLAIDPSAHYAHFVLGMSLKQLGRPAEARTHLRLAVALSPTSRIYAGALNRLGPPPEPEVAPGAAAPEQPHPREPADPEPPDPEPPVRADPAD